MDGVRRRRRGISPPILTLLDLFEEHRAAFEYDWRNRLHSPLSDVGEAMTYGEAWRLTGILAADPSTAVAAAMLGWESPASRESLVLMDLYDLQHRSKSKKKPKPYPRPWGDKDRKKYGRSAFSPEQTRAILDARRRRPAGRKRDARGRFA